MWNGVACGLVYIGMSMRHRDRLLRALNHKEPDRIPLDLGSHPNASIHLEAYENLKAYLGVDSPTKIMHRWMQVAVVDEAVLKLFGIDTRGLPLGKRDKQLERELDETTYADQWGVVRVQPEGALYYELSKSPLSGEISPHDILSYPWPDPEDPGIIRNVRERAKRLRDATDYAIVLTLPAAFVHYSQFLRGFEDWYLDCALHPDLSELLYDSILEINIASARMILKEVGDLVDVVVTADDIGDQRGTIVSPAMYRRLIKPRHARYFDEIHRLTSARILFHTCGSVVDVLEDLIEIGVDALNPVQVSARGMDTRALKAKAGKKLAFWGGIDTHDVLPRGTRSQVEGEVRRRIEELGRGGGYVLASVHNLQPGVPPENICKMFAAGRKLGVYSRNPHESA